MYDCYQALTIHWLWIVRAHVPGARTQLWVTDCFGDLVPSWPKSESLSHFLYNHVH